MSGGPVRCSPAPRAALLRWPPCPPARLAAKPLAASPRIPRTPETTVSALALGQLLHLAPGDAGDRADHQLRDAVAAADRDRLASEVDEQHPDLAAVVGVDRAGRVQHREAVARGEAATCPDLPFEPGR